MRTTEKIIVDYNPSEASSYLYSLDMAKTIEIHSTYHDNPFLSQVQKDEIEDLKRTDDDMYQIFALGKRCFSKQNVYKKWEVMVNKPQHLNEFIYGIDFGSSHPTALVKIWFNTDTKELFLEELIYESGLTSGDIVEMLDKLGVDKTKPIVADYARPEIINDIKRGGYQCINAVKDVKDGINNVKLFKVYVSSTSSNIIKENENYKYKKLNGIITDEVIKMWDDAIDAIRYGVMYIKKYHWKSDDRIGIYKFNI
jgi:phage terminase large subunit